MRTAMAVWLSPLRRDDDSDGVPVEELVALLDQIFVLPSNLQIASEEVEAKANELVGILAEESGKFNELLSLLFWVKTQRRSSNLKELGMISSDKYRNTFVEPLQRLVERLAAARKSSTATDGGSHASQEQHWQQIELLQIALQRLTDSQN